MAQISDGTLGQLALIWQSVPDGKPRRELMAWLVGAMSAHIKEPQASWLIADARKEADRLAKEVRR